MNVQIARDSDFIELKNLVIEIDNTRYRLSQTIDGRLKVNKVSLDGLDDYLRIHPCSGNETDLS